MRHTEWKADLSVGPGYFNREFYIKLSTLIHLHAHKLVSLALNLPR
jgi:hypothetical protein